MLLCATTYGVIIQGVNLVLREYASSYQNMFSPQLVAFWQITKSLIPDILNPVDHECENGEYKCAGIYFQSPLPMTDITNQSESCLAHDSKHIIWSQGRRHFLSTILTKWYFGKSIIFLPAEYRSAPCILVTPLEILFPVIFSSHSLAFLLEEGWKNFKPVTYWYNICFLLPFSDWAWHSSPTISWSCVRKSSPLRICVLKIHK